MSSNKQSSTQIFQNSKEQSFGQVPSHRLRDHPNEFFYPINNEKENMLYDRLKATKITNSRNFIPQDREVQADQMKSSSTINQFYRGKLTRSTTKQDSIELSAREKKYLNLQSSLFQDEEKDQKSPLKKQPLQEQNYSRQKSIEQVKFNNYLHPKKQKYEQPSHKEKIAEVKNFGMQRAGDIANDEKLRMFCKEQGYHVVFCKDENNKVNNEPAVNQSFMLRRSIERAMKATDDLKEQLKQQGIQLYEKRTNNQLKDFVPKCYIKQQEQMKELKQERGRLVRNASEMRGRAIQNRYLEFSKNL